MEMSATEDYEHSLKILHELGFDDLRNEEVQLLMPWLKNIQPENIVSPEAVEAYEAAEALELTPEDIVTQIREHGINLEYLNNTDDECMKLLEEELMTLNQINLSDNSAREECEKMKKVLDELQEEDRIVSCDLKNAEDSCCEIWENIQKERQKICERIQKIVSDHFSNNGVDHFETFLHEYEEKLIKMSQIAINVLNNGMKELKSTQVESPPIVQTQIDQDMVERMTDLKRSLAQMHYMTMVDVIENGNTEENTGNSQNNFCIRNYLHTEDMEFKWKTLCACEELADYQVIIKAVIPETRRRCARKKLWLQFCQKLLGDLEEQRNLQDLVSILLSLWNQEKRVLHSILNECIQLFEQDYLNVTKRIGAMEEANKKFEAYIGSSEFEENCLPALVCKTVEKCNIPNAAGLSLKETRLMIEGKVDEVLQMQDRMLHESANKIQELESTLAKKCASVESLEKKLNEMQGAYDSSKELLEVEQERHEEFKNILEENERLRDFRLLWVYSLTNTNKLKEIAAIEEESEECTSQNIDFTNPLFSSTPRSPPDAAFKF